MSAGRARAVLAPDPLTNEWFDETAGPACTGVWVDRARNAGRGAGHVRHCLAAGFVLGGASVVGVFWIILKVRPRHRIKRGRPRWICATLGHFWKDTIAGRKSMAASPTHAWKCRFAHVDHQRPGSPRSFSCPKTSYCDRGGIKGGSPHPSKLGRPAAPHNACIKRDSSVV